MEKGNIRLWPAYLFTAIIGILLIWLWLFFDTIRADKITGTFSLVLLLILLLLVWLLFLSKLKLKIKLISLLIISLCASLFFLMFEITDFSGDLMPELSLRWSKKSVEYKNKTKESISDLHGTNSSHFDYPQFLGPNRDAILTNIKLEKDWETYPPKLLWKQPVGPAWSSFVVSGNFAVTQEQREDKEAVVCYELISGDIIWIHTDKARYETALGGIGPRATPTIDGSKVYTLGATGIFNCLELLSGKKVWQTDIWTENNAKMPEWGYSGSPLVLDSLVIVCPGGNNGKSVVAYDKETGKQVWSSGSDPAAYASPMIADISGAQQILIFTNDNIVSHSTVNGEIYWQFPWPGQTQRVSQPVVVKNNQLFASTGYGVGSKLIELKKSNGGIQPHLIWETKKLKSKFASLILKDNFIYGLDDGILVCLDLKNGQRRWKKGRYGHGQIILVNHILLITSERGELVLVEANPYNFTELAKIPGIEGKTWNNPAFPAPYLLVRNAREAACYELTLTNLSKFDIN